MKKRLGKNKIRKMNRKIVSIAICLVGILIGISSVGAVIENDTINQTNDIVNASETMISNTSNTMPKKTIDDGPIVNIPDKQFMPEHRESVIVYFKQMPPSIKGFANKYRITPIFVKQDINMVGFETMPEKEIGRTSQRTQDIVSTLSNDPLVEKAFIDEYRFTNAKKNYSATASIQGPEFYESMGLAWRPHKVVVQFWRFPPSLEEFASKNGATVEELGEANKFFTYAVFNASNVSHFINKISIDPYVKFVFLDSIDPSTAAMYENASKDDDGTKVDTDSVDDKDEKPKVPGFESITSVLILICVALIVSIVRRR